MGLAGVERRAREHFHLSTGRPPGCGRGRNSGVPQDKGKLDESRRTADGVRGRWPEGGKSTRMKTVFMEGTHPTFSVLIGVVGIRVPRKRRLTREDTRAWSNFNDILSILNIRQIYTNSHILAFSGIIFVEFL